MTFVPYEEECTSSADVLHVAGVDEAGRGPWAGPVVAAAVIFPQGEWRVEGLKDSKRLSAKQRDKLYEIICKKAVCYATGAVCSEEIDRINILQATFKAMTVALGRMAVKPDFVLVDGNMKIPIDIPVKAIVKGDSLCASIAAASILAKVTRDRIMAEYSFDHPQYGFLAHKGYGTCHHAEMLAIYGPCEIHRRSFRPVKKVLAALSKDTVSVGI